MAGSSRIQDLNERDGVIFCAFSLGPQNFLLAAERDYSSIIDIHPKSTQKLDISTYFFWTYLFPLYRVILRMPWSR